MGDRPEEKEWYSNKQLYEMMVELSKGLEATSAELGKTQVMIRDYNGLREKVDDVERRMNVMDGKDCGNDHAWSYVFAGCGMLISISAVIVAIIK